MNYLITLLNLKVSSEEEMQDLQIQMLVVKEFITSKFGNLTVPEIKEAFKMYVAREFPQIKVFRMLDSVNAGEVLSAYVDFRNESLRVYTDKKTAALNAPTKPTDEEKRKIRDYFLLVLYDDLIKDGFSNDAWQLFFDLESSGKIQATTEEKKKLYQQELQKYIPEHKEQLRAKSAYYAKHLIKEFQNEIDSGKSIVVVQNKCRSIMVSDYLKKHLSDFESFKKAIES